MCVSQRDLLVKCFRFNLEGGEIQMSQTGLETRLISIRRHLHRYPQ